MSSLHPSSSKARSDARNAREAAATEPHPDTFAVDISDNASFEAGVPHDYFRALREHDPVHWQEECELPGIKTRSGYWALTRYADVVHVSKNASTFSSQAGSSVLSNLEPKDLANMRKQLIHMDPPQHTELRKLMNPPFKPRAIQDSEPSTQRIVHEIFEKLPSSGVCDFVDDISAPISLRVLTHFLGVPDMHARLFYRWTNLLIGASDPEVSSVRRARLAVLQLLLYAAPLKWWRQLRPTDDVYSRLVSGELDGKRLEGIRLGMNFFLLIVAGNETTRNALSGGVRAFCDHPDQLALLRRDPSLLPSAIEEILRFVTPVMQFRRTATRDTQIGDQPIRAGDKLVMYYGAANRDPRVFEDPERFDITRTHNPHVAFGTGTHVCMGTHMARITMRLTLQALLAHSEVLELAGPVERLSSNFINGVRRMPIRFG
jgi:cholest-4-en-3-one 26-monooxygenase